MTVAKLIKIIDKVIYKRMKLQLFINFDGSGKFSIEIKLGGESAEKMFLDN